MPTSIGLLITTLGCPVKRRPSLRFQFALRTALTMLTFVSGGLTVPSARAAEPLAGEVEFFEKEVRPLLVEKCQKCHGDKKPKRGLGLTSRTRLLQGGDSGPAVVAGKPDESLLVRAIRYEE